MKEEIFRERVSELIQDQDSLQEINKIKEEFSNFEKKEEFLCRPISETSEYIFCFDNLGQEEPLSGIASN